MLEQVPDELRQTFLGASVAMAMAGLGRMLWHINEVRLRRRKFFSIHLVWEVMTALAMGFVADGIAVYLQLSDKPALALIVVISYLGPRGIETMVASVAEGYFKKGKEND